MVFPVFIPRGGGEGLRAQNSVLVCILLFLRLTFYSCVRCVNYLRAFVTTMFWPFSYFSGFWKNGGGWPVITGGARVSWIGANVRRYRAYNWTGLNVRTATA